ncbi:OB-fold domain-containing protein [Acidiferrimicrobium sp. IK]|uniref:thiolase C-terminal domain-containing protein n=1 Tax=Acidiferrimicrobium sp. IK TaxID=2871700 RepID=UPI0021CB20CC|nr:OB-fold domain-containing protein [Acidiferrimicrobium sp. IK]MCU4182887.1 OB-fold domain-containing protein [Acidiferrimicrobium sp. IK]
MPDAAGRPLPLLTIDNAFFWASGSDGRLRLQRCGDCGQLRFPVAPICPYCHSTVTEIAELSGRATVVGSTVNHQQWSPALVPPYSIAVVALEDDPRIRLTTNITGCPPDEVRLGLRVAVHFEQLEDGVWLPLFSPTGDADGDWHVPEPEEAPARGGRGTGERFEAKAAITGIGMSQVGRRLMRPPLALTVEAALAAVEDAGLGLEDIDGLSTYPGGPGMGGHSEGGTTPLIEALRLQPTWINGGGETPGQIGALIAAMMAVGSGLCRHVLVFRTVWEATHAAMLRSGAFAPEPGRASGFMEGRLPYGAFSAANWIAIAASQHFARFGTTREQLGAIALNARRNAALNPAAVYKDPLTMEEYLSARMVSTPFGLYDCDVPCDGAVAVVVSARDAARDLRRPAVLVDAVGTQIADRVSWDQGTLTHEPQVVGPARHLWNRTELTKADVDVALLYDGFSFNCLSWIEAFGFCGIGEGGPFVEGGRRIALDGELPLNPNGGQLSGGRLHGYGFVHEAVVQLRGDGGERQVRGAEVALVATGGGVPGGCALFTTDR